MQQSAKPDLSLITVKGWERTKKIVEGNGHSGRGCGFRMLGARDFIINSIANKMKIIYT